MTTVFVLTTSAATASVVTFDWPNPPGWTAGTPTTGQTATQSFTSVSPNDITVSIYNGGVNNQAGYPAINSTNETGGFSGVNALQLYLSSTPTFGNVLKTTVTFASPVTNLSFQLWDVDASTGQFVDKIANLQALAQGGGTVGATSVTSAVAGYNTITGTGLSTVITGTNPANNSTNQGTINVTFTGTITQFSFEWSNNDNGLGAQAIGLGPLTYDTVPEYDWPFGGAAACLMAVLHERMRRVRRQKADVRGHRSHVS
jgi:hypothetical protein